MNDSVKDFKEAYGVAKDLQAIIEGRLEIANIAMNKMNREMFEALLEGAEICNLNLRKIGINQNTEKYESKINELRKTYDLK